MLRPPCCARPPDTHQTLEEEGIATTLSLSLLVIDPRSQLVSQPNKEMLGFLNTFGQVLKPLVPDYSASASLQLWFPSCHVPAGPPTPSTGLLPSPCSSVTPPGHTLLPAVPPTPRFNPSPALATGCP
eukprot:GFUD01016227.1.p2 GENE.GFUD01016227.1~~GFUD01016227.1.p2  ORF type:complete len:128 (-),score=24.69 GFUD01016227.1:303-686(-)